MFVQGYELEVFSPFFYSSFEGNVISTEGIISSTALTYALADALRLRIKDYFLLGKEAITPKYEELAGIPIFVTDGTPIKLNHTSIDFRSAMFWAEENILFNIGREKGKKYGEKTELIYPPILDTANRSPFLKQERRYIGIENGSKFQCIIASKEKLYDEFFINLGIRRSGEVRLKRIEKLPERVILNYFMLEKVYNIPRGKLLPNGAKIKRAGDYRLLFILDVPRQYFEKEILPEIVKTWK